MEFTWSYYFDHIVYSDFDIRYYKKTVIYGKNILINTANKVRNPKKAGSPLKETGLLIHRYKRDYIPLHFCSGFCAIILNNAPDELNLILTRQYSQRL